ncbi:hypothetical protein Syun_013824 [Stephania yunnanensis]|uniref:Replication protein A 70 kDa DNA-binding subunit B/D first OB fold domain-containing protein n=1 Tax=Stephania yunnanensis TaxID=152371 RepID=A0AAP0JIL0_9MAGN
MPRVKKLLKDIDLNTVNWYVDVYVLEKLPIKQSNTSSVRQQQLILVDEEGYRIQAKIFGNDINLFESRLQTKVAYRISNAFVKEIEARHRLVPSPHQWSISRNTLIKKVPDSETFPLIEEVKFVTLDEIDEYLDIDEYIVLALIAKPRRDVIKRNGQPASLQELIVIDECCMPIRLTLWDEFATKIGPSVEERIAKTQVLVCRRLKVAYHSGEVFYCTNCNHEDAHDTPRARIEVEITDESGALKVVAYGSNLDLNGDNGNIDGPLVANAQTSVCGSAHLKETNGEVIVETGEVILHTVASATTSSKRETSNFTSRSSKLLKPVVVSLESTSTSSG